ncbi:hypothetical protein [Fictibacillus barbaricus]|uniref:CopG family transcriptional regulator n=1 Tax=Fictibacillus barbaricus TaxID=182136 RepID=A0ABS2Z7V1_9BACL|nr:hypothetical protein [Fictibacillus barbaricus]MBN3544103.1 hypothetical protein [Fictibacillus barbaricus]GGB68952.1 hypothetical protein GCM10007199_38920 [Fictibacillus barbaricus]
MSNKSSLKDKIKKPNATQTFFNSYDNVDVKKEDRKETEIKNNEEDIIKNEDEVASEIYDMNDNNIDNVVDNKNNNDEDDDYLRMLASGNKIKKQKKKKVFTSFYMDPDLAVEVDNIASRGEKGDKSKLINKAIRSLLEQYGVIEKSR